MRRVSGPHRPGLQRQHALNQHDTKAAMKVLRFEFFCEIWIMSGSRALRAQKVPQVDDPRGNRQQSVLFFIFPLS